MTHANSRSACAALVCLLAFLAPASAFADCVGDATAADVKRAYADGRKLEKVGEAAQAVDAYVRAQAYVCGGNPVNGDAARRAAPLALNLGKEAERAGKLVDASGTQPSAYRWYEAGGHYADADRVLAAALRAAPQDMALYQLARRHFGERALPSFQSNNKTRIDVVGGYRLDSKLLDEVNRLPAANVDRSLKAEEDVFSEQYLEDFAALVKARPENPTDVIAMHKAQQAQQAFQSKWRSDALRDSRDRIEQARRWAVLIAGPAARDKGEAKARQRAVARADRLLQRYADVPDFIEAAIDYYYQAGVDAKADQARALAAKQGEAASKAGRHATAARFFHIAGDDDRAEQARARAEQTAMQSMAPGMEQQRQLMEQMQKAYTPEKIEAMRRQAEEMQRMMQSSQGGQQFQQETDDLEKELDLD